MQKLLYLRVQMGKIKFSKLHNNSVKGVLKFLVQLKAETKKINGARSFSQPVILPTRQINRKKGDTWLNEGRLEILKE